MSDADNPIEPENLVAAAIEAAQDILDDLGQALRISQKV